MVKWLDIELQLATLQILLDAESLRGKSLDEIDYSWIHKINRETAKAHHREVAANDGFVTENLIAKVFSIDASELETAIKFLKSNELISVSEKGLLITAKGEQFVRDELNKKF